MTQALDIGVLSISGIERQPFAQGLVTCDLNQLTDNTASLCAFCNAKGRVIANFMVLMHKTAIYFILPSNMVSLLLKALTKYALFSKVTLNDDSNRWYCYGTTHQKQQTNTNSSFSLIIEDGRFQINYPSTTLSRSLIVTTIPQPLIENSLSNTAWQLANISDGIADIQPQTSGLFTPQMINLEQLGGVSFNKGCYLGQEIIARTQHLGKLKRHLRQVQFATQQNTQAGDPITTEDNSTVGQLLNHAAKDQQQSLGLAVIEDRAINSPLLINNRTLTLNASAETK